MVVDASGNPLHDVHLELQIGPQRTRLVTDEQGRFCLSDSEIEQLSGRTPLELRVRGSRVGHAPLHFKGRLFWEQNDAGRIRITEIRPEESRPPRPAVASQQNGMLRLRMSPAVYDAETVVVTATRTRRDLEEVSLPVNVITAEEVQRAGSMRLDEVLSEQTGLQLVHDHGTGIQVQGFDPDYTLIMIDGSPVIGRSAGTLDLTRISVQNVEQIEVVKGPSSALWGSDALAGVINIITEKPGQEAFSASLSSRYGSHNTLDLSGQFSHQSGGWENQLFANLNRSGGYRLNADALAQTVPDFENLTLNYSGSYAFSESLKLSTGLRYFEESQRNQDRIQTEDSQRRELRILGDERDVMIRPALEWRPLPELRLEASWNSSMYEQESDMRFQDDGQVYDASSFRQFYNKPELQAEYQWASRPSLSTTSGGGAIMERLDAGRYPSDPAFTTAFAYAQQHWRPDARFELTAGLRYDAHSEYSAQLSPKFSTRYRLSDQLQLRASLGRGFKAPEFRQLFLDFNNSTAGYSVFGYSTVEDGLGRLMQEGRISEILIPLEQLEQIRAESSWAINAGGDLDAGEYLRLRLNLFANQVDNLIETAPIARRTNGQSVFTYFNVNEVRTRGLESELRFQWNERFRAALGYQLLDARRRIERQRRVQDENGELVERTDISYEPMFNRSRHSGTVKLYYDAPAGWGANMRASLRGPYALFDTNGNEFADENEYENGYTVWNTAVYRQLLERYTLQLGVDNLTGYTSMNQPNLPGRLWYLQLRAEF